MGAPFSMAGSTSFGWMTPFDWFSILLRSWAGAVGSAPGVASRGAEFKGAPLSRLGKCRAGGKRSAGDQQAKSCSDDPHVVQICRCADRSLARDCEGGLKSNTAPPRTSASLQASWIEPRRAVALSADELQQQPTDCLGLFLLNPMSGAVDEMRAPPLRTSRGLHPLKSARKTDRRPNRFCPR